MENLNVYFLKSKTNKMRFHRGFSFLTYFNRYILSPNSGTVWSQLLYAVK